MELDRVQCRMMAIIIPCTRMTDEEIGVFCRRRLRLARNFCESAGFWSLLWCDRVVKWNQHIHRGASCGHMCATLIDYNNSDWLMHMRSFWVPSHGDSSGYSLTGGRTGTRCSNGRPQPRWEEGITLAKAVVQSREMSNKGSNALSVGTRIREALVSVRAAVQNSHVSNPAG